MKTMNPRKKKPENRKIPPLESVGYPRPLYGDISSSLYDIPGYRSVGRKGNQLIPLEAEELIPIPAGAKLFSLPGREPLLWKKEQIEHLPSPLTAVGVSLPSGYLARSLSAYAVQEPSEENLPSFTYAALACWQNKNWVAAGKIKHRDEEFLPQFRLLSPDPNLQVFASERKEEMPKGSWELVILFCPGVTDSESEWLKWEAFFENHSPTSVRLENLTCEWDSFFAFLETQQLGDAFGLEIFLEKVKEKLPEAQLDEMECYWKKD